MNRQKKILGSLFITGFLSLILVLNLQAQKNLKSPYEVNDLVNTRLDVSFDFAKHQLYGEEWITVRPDSVPTDSLLLDATAMDFKEIALVLNGSNVPLKYSYNGSILTIRLGKHYKTSQSYTVYIKYIAKPDEVAAVGSNAISQVHGLYFINTDGQEENKPVQIWTQGEPNGSSKWFPTIDHPEQKTLQQISITVPEKYNTLSNGKLIAQKQAGNGLRTDTWKMDKPHAPYLFMMAVGEFSIYRDKWKNTEVNYYLEKAYAQYAKQIFGNTPEMMSFFSAKLGVPFPWNKYSQVVVRDYASGAMENTTATLLGESIQKSPREMLDTDYGKGESIIAHELFHQWFGNYVTCKDWANLTVNESFASYGETIWAAHKYGVDAGDAHINAAMQQYFGAKNAAGKTLVRKNYGDVLEMFDEVSYQKGACILNMLKTHLGETVFFKGLHLYLTKYALGSATAIKLKQTFETASGKDLNWFFDQWYNRPGHPELKITYKWDEAARQQTVFLEQTQQGEAFILPMAIDIYLEKQPVRKMIVMNNKKDTFVFKVASRPELVNVDADKTLLVDKEDKKTVGELSYQYFHAAKFADRSETVAAFAQMQNDPEAMQMLTLMLKDRYYGLRIYASQNLNLQLPRIKALAVPLLVDIAQNDEYAQARAEALRKLGETRDTTLLDLFTKAIKDESYEVEGAALNAISGINQQKALQYARELEKDHKGSLTSAIVRVYAYYGSEEQLPFVVNAFENSDAESRFDRAKAITILLANINNTSIVKSYVDMIRDLAIEYKSLGVGKYAIKWLNTLKKKKQDKAGGAEVSLKEALLLQVGDITNAIEAIQNAS
jgi:aminopeptidase N